MPEQTVEAAHGHPTRRQVFATAAGAVGALAIQAAVRPQEALAGTDGDVVLGDNNFTSSVTAIQCTDAHGLEVVGTDRGVSGSAKADSNSAGVYGNSASTVAAQPGGDGVFGTGDRCGVHGTATAIGGGNPGVWGQNDFTGNGVQGTSAAGDGVQGYGGGTGRGVYGQGGSGGGNGVQGYAGSASAVGVFAVNVFGGIGLFGASDVAGGTGVKGEGAAVGVAAVATSATGLGLDVHGPAKFSRSGVVTISGTKAKPRSSAVVSVPGRPLRAHSLILATPQTYLSGLSVAATVPHSTTFRIHLTRAVHTKVKVAWFIVD